MIQLTFNIDGDILSLIGKRRINSGTVNAYKCRFIFPPEWDGGTKFATFCGTDEKNYTVEISDEECFVPAQAAAQSGTMTVGVFSDIIGADNVSERRQTSNFVTVSVTPGAFGGDTPEAPEPTVWEEYYRKSQEMIDAGTSAVENASLATIAANDAAAAATEAGDRATEAANMIGEDLTLIEKYVDDQIDARLGVIQLAQY